MFALIEAFDGCTFLRKERQSEVARVVDRGGRKIDLFAGSGLLAAALQFVESRRWNLNSIHDEHTLVTLDEVDADL